MKKIILTFILIASLFVLAKNSTKCSCDNCFCDEMKNITCECEK